MAVVTRSNRKKLIFDNDGVLAPAGGSQSVANDPPPVLKTILKRAAIHNDIIILSGQPLGVIESMRDKLEIPVILAPDYGSFLMKGEEKEFLVSGHSLEMLRRADELVSPMMWTLGGKRDKRKAIGLFTHFWDDKEEWLEAQKKLEAVRFNETFLRQIDLRIQWNIADYSANVLPIDAGKKLVANRFRNDGVVVGAGDTCSDIPILEVAKFPIVAHDESFGAHPCLLGILEQKGIGYVAPPHLSHGWGTAEGLEKAAELGLIRL